MKVMEIVWLIMGFSALGAGVHAFVYGEIKKSIVFFVMVVISFFIFTMRIRMRKMNEKKDNDPES